MSEERLALYLDLKPGAAADIEVVAQAAIAWSKAVKELAYVLDPALEIRVELRSGSEGSLSLNSLIRDVRNLPHDKARLRRIAVALSFFFGVEVVHYGIDRGLDALTGATDSEQADHDQRVIEAYEKGVARGHIQDVYRTLERDPVVNGVGVSFVPGQRPPVVVPRSEFRLRGGYGAPREETVKRRITPDRIQAMVVKPVLVPDRNRKWRLQTEHGELGFYVRDDDFVRRVLAGKTRVPLRYGIVLDIEIETKEEFKGGVWVPTERTVTHVYDVQQPSTTAPLPFDFELSEPDDDDD